MQPFLVASPDVEQNRVGAKRSRDDPEHRDPTDVLVGHRLEDMEQRFLLGVGHDLDLLVAGSNDRRAVGRRRSEPTEVIAEEIDTDTGRAGPDQHGELGACPHLAGEGPLQLSRGQLGAVEIPLEHVVVAGDDFLDDAVVYFVFMRSHLRRQWLDVATTVRVVLVGLLRQDVGHAVELGGFTERQLEWREAGPERTRERSDDALEVGALLVLAGDEDQPWKAQVGALAPGDLGADLDPVGGAHHEHGEIRDRESAIELCDEVGVARCVQQVDAEFAVVAGPPVERCDPGRDRRPTMDFFGLVVEDRRAVPDRADPTRDAGEVE